MKEINLVFIPSVPVVKGFMAILVFYIDFQTYLNQMCKLDVTYRKNEYVFCF